MITLEVVARLKADATLAALLSTYEGAAAVFSISPVPPDAVLPYIITDGNLSDNAADSKTTLGREIYRDIRCYAVANGSIVMIDAIAERVRWLFHRKSLTVDGHVNYHTTCSGPIRAETDETVYGRVVTVRFMLQEV